MSLRTAPGFLLYDRECRICTAVARWVKRLDWRGRLRIQSIQDSLELLHGVPADRALDAMHVVRPGGDIVSGADALPALAAGLWSGPEFERLLRSSPTTAAATRRVYAFLVRFRGRLTCRPSS